MDLDLRELERRAKEGDIDALERWIIAALRLRNAEILQNADRVLFLLFKEVYDTRGYHFTRELYNLGLYEPPENLATILKRLGKIRQLYWNDQDWWRPSGYVRWPKRGGQRFQHNPDFDLRSLERDTAGGDEEAKFKLAVELERRDGLAHVLDKDIQSYRITFWDAEERLYRWQVATLIQVLKKTFEIGFPAYTDFLSDGMNGFMVAVYAGDIGNRTDLVTFGFMGLHDEMWSEFIPDLFDPQSGIDALQRRSHLRRPDEPFFHVEPVGSREEVTIIWNTRYQNVSRPGILQETTQAWEAWANRKAVIKHGPIETLRRHKIRAPRTIIERWMLLRERNVIGNP